MHPTLELLRNRKLSNSLPGHRTDKHRLALVLEGGSSRAAYGGGMVGILEEADLLSAFDDVYGTSAGALNGAWFICQGVNQNLHGWWAAESMKGTIKLANALRGGPVVDGDYLVDHVYENFTKMGFEEILASAVGFHPVATDADTGQSLDLAPFIETRADLKTALKATTRIPLLSGKPVELGSRRFIDGGMAENIPVETAMAQGATHLLVIRTKVPSLELPLTNSLKQGVVTRWMKKNASGAVHTWTGRNRRKQELEQLMSDRSDCIFQVAPPADAPKISMVGSNAEVLKQAVEIGQKAMRAELEPIGLLDDFSQ